MEKLAYPVLLYPLTPELVLGILVGTNIRTSGPDMDTVMQELNDHLQREYKKNEWYPWIELTDYKFKHAKFPVRPMERDQNGTFPWSHEIRVPVSAIYGESEDEGEYLCYLPLLDEEFYYYHRKQFTPLLRHMAQNALLERSPSELMRLSQLPEPELRSISLRVNYNRMKRPRGIDLPNHYAYLERIADRFPPSRADRKLSGGTSTQVFEREEEIQLLMDRIIVQRANILLVGSPGVGKSAVLSQAIRRIENRSRRNQVPYTFWRVQAQRITAGSKYLGEWQQNVQRLIHELRMANGMLWIESFLQLARSGGTGPEDSIAAFLYPYLLRGEIQILGEVTPTELDRLRQWVPDFTHVFQQVEIKPLSELQNIRVLEKYSTQQGKKLKLKIAADNLAYIYRLLDRFIPRQQFPGKGIHFLANLFHWARSQKLKALGRPEIISRFSAATGLPEVFLRDDLLLDQEALQHYFNSRIIGQDDAIRHLIQVVKIYKAGLNNPNKPITTLLFAGPTGVGKTATARALADYFFGQGQRQSPLVRIDMSEFQFAFQVSRLIGDDNTTGQLVREMGNRSFAVLLFDEVEKANPVILDALLGLLDEGRMTDASGRVIHFQNSIVILTTNLGAGDQQTIGFGNTDSEETRFQSAIAAHFRPEFINRIDQTVIFRPLEKEAVLAITDLELKQFAQRPGLQKRRIQLIFTNALRRYLAEQGFDRRYGARPLQRTIDQVLGRIVTDWMSAHPKKKSGTLQLDYTDGKITTAFQV